MKEEILQAEYKRLFIQIKEQINSGQTNAALAVNNALIQLYWNVGKMIAENQALFEGRNSFIAQLANDLITEFPGISGFSKRNLFDIRRFYLFYSSDSVQQLVALSTSWKDSKKEIPADSSVRHPAALNPSEPNLPQFIFYIPWGHHLLLLNKVKQPDAALFYMQQTVEYNWSRAILTIQIEQDLFARQGKAVTNFNSTLPAHQALLAQQLLKDPYNFNFLTLEPNVQELELEKQLTGHITKFLLELGKGFAFIGRQFRLSVGSKDYAIDLLFYHIRLRCFVVIDLKTTGFEPEYTGKMNFYLSAIDDQLKAPEDNPSIGILICKNKENLEVEYALRGINKPIGVSEFTFTEALPAELQSSIPTVEEFENEIKRLADLSE